MKRYPPKQSRKYAKRKRHFKQYQDKRRATQTKAKGE